MTEKNKDKFNVLTQKVDNLKLNVAGLLKQRQRPILDMIFEKLEARTQVLQKNHNPQEDKVEKVLCPKCDAVLPLGIHFCPECGSAVSKRAREQEKQRRELEISQGASIEMET